jgi:hypothetical protein
MNGCCDMLKYVVPYQQTCCPFLYTLTFIEHLTFPLTNECCKNHFFFPLQKNHYLFLGQKKCVQCFIVLSERLVMGWKFYSYYIPSLEASKFYYIHSWHCLEQRPCTKILSLLPVWVGISLSCLQFIPISNDVHIFWEKRTFNFATFNYPFFPHFLVLSKLESNRRFENQ